MIQQIAEDSLTLDYAVVHIANPTDFMSGVNLTFNIPSFESGTFTAEAVYVEPIDTTGYVWHGQIQTLGKGDFMIAIEPSSAPSGFIRFPDKYFGLHGLRSNLGVLVKQLLVSSESTEDAIGEATIDSVSAINDDPCVLDILVLETPEVRAKLLFNGNTFLSVAASTINTALYQSQAKYKRVRVWRDDLPFSVGTDDQCNVSYILDQYDASAMYKRQIKGADIAILLTLCSKPSQTVFGVAWLSSDPTPFAVVRVDYALGGRFTFAHEFAHLLGADHNRISNGGDAPNDDLVNHCWRFFDQSGTQQWTLLAKMDASATRLLNYSNPNVLHNGAPTGTITDFNAAIIKFHFCKASQLSPSPSTTFHISGNSQLCKSPSPDVFWVNTELPLPGNLLYEWRWSPTMFSSTNIGFLLSTNRVLSLATPPTCDGKFYLKVTVRNASMQILYEYIQVLDPSECTDCPGLGKTSSISLVSNPEQKEKKASFSISPNPTTGRVSIGFDDLMETNREVHIQISSSRGELMYAQKHSVNKYGVRSLLIDLSSLPNGVYLIKVAEGTLNATKTFTVLK